MFLGTNGLTLTELLCFEEIESKTPDYQCAKQLSLFGIG
jgi:hypothetical protein